MDRYSRRNLEDLVVPNYHETSDLYTSLDMWGTAGWSKNSSEAAAEKCFDYAVINNGFSGGLYSQVEMGTSEEVEVETKRLKAIGCSDHSLHDFDGIQHMDDIFLNSILEDVPWNGNLDSFKESDNNNSPASSFAYLEDSNGKEVPMFCYNWETCQDMPLMEEAPMNLCEEAFAEEDVLQDLQRATENLTDDTRKCFRDTFYRLANNLQQKSDTNSEEFLEDRTNRKTELETNSIDRAIANLTFNRMESNMRNCPPQKRVSSIQG